MKKVNYATYLIQSNIDHCNSMVKMFQKKEDEYRKQGNWHMVRYCKQKARQYLADANWFNSSI